MQSLRPELNRTALGQARLRAPGDCGPGRRQEPQGARAAVAPGALTPGTLGGVPPRSDILALAPRTLKGPLFAIGDEELVEYRQRWRRLHPYRVPREGFDFQSDYHVALTDEVRGKLAALPGVDESVMWGEFFFVEALQKALAVVRG